MFKPRIIIHLEGGLVQNVISDEPLDYVVADTDTDGCAEDDVTKTPEPLKRHIRSKEMWNTKHIHPATVDARAVNATINHVNRITD